MDRLPRILVIALLTVFILTGLFARMEADDYCVAGLVDAQQVHHPDPAAYTIAMYTGWNGRYSQLFLQSMLHGIEPLGSMLMPGLLIVAAVYLLKRLMGLDFALCMAAAGLLALPDVGGTFYWLSSSLTYVAPLVVFLLALVAYRERWRYLVPLLFGLGLLAGGFGETGAIVLGLLWLCFAGYRGASWAWFTGLVIAFAIVYAAPGNAIRSSYFTDTRDLNAAWYAAWDWWLNSGPIIAAGLGGYVLAFAAGYALPLPDARRNWWKLWALAFAVMFGTMMAVTYGAGYSYRPDRTLVIPAALWALAWYAIGSALAGKRKGKRGKWLMVTVLVVCLIAPVTGLIEMARYGRQWDARDALIRQGQTTVPALDSARDSLQSDPVDWVNVCAAAWYQVDEIQVGAVSGLQNVSRRPEDRQLSKMM